jgi:hypothetical protein
MPPFQPGHAKVGGKVKGSKHGPKPLKMADTPQNRAALVLATEIRTPKAVMLDAMAFFDTMARQYHQGKDYDKAAKFMASAVQVAEKVAPYIHARLIAVADNTKRETVPFVVRTPSVITDSTAWQAATGMPSIEVNAPGVPNMPPAPMPHPAAPQAQQTAIPEIARPSTAMPVGPATLQPAGAEEWLNNIAQGRKTA